MEFFSSPSLPKLPFPGEPRAPQNWLGLWGQSHPLSLGPTSVWGRFWDCPVLGYFQEKTGGGALRPCHNGMGRVTHSSGLLFLPSRAVAREREEGDQMVGCQRKLTSFVPHAWALQPCAPQACSCLGSKLQ